MGPLKELYAADRGRLLVVTPTSIYNVSTLWGKEMRIEVQKWGNSAAVRVPSTALKAAGIRVGQSLELRVEGGALVMEPAAESLDDLLARMTPHNMHGLELDGPAAGAEVW